MNTDELGNLGLSQAEERAIVAFMGALSDGYPPARAVLALTLECAESHTALGERVHRDP